MIYGFLLICFLYLKKIGVAIDSDNQDDILIYKQVGKVAALRELVEAQSIDFEKTFISHATMVKINDIIIIFSI